MITTEAWVLYQGPEVGRSQRSEPGELIRESFSFPDLEETEILAEPIYGGWEANLNHAIERNPIDICRQRGEEKIVIGNSGIVRILKTGSAVTDLKEGDYCVTFADAVTDKYGYTVKVFAYDAPHTMGLLARQTKIQARYVVPIPKNTRHSLKQWASLARYFTAWSNWNVAYACLRSQLFKDECPAPFVWGWGGGVSLAELQLANYAGCRTAMIASEPERLALIASKGIEPINRTEFRDLAFDEGKYHTDLAYKARYSAAEKVFLNLVLQKTGGEGVHIFIDNIGTPVYRATLRALAREGVITTCGWKHGMAMSNLRAVECIGRHVHVHTHAARHREGLETINFAEEHGWMPQAEECTAYSWDQVPQLASDYAAGKISSYFPLYEIYPA